ncbi:MAG: Dabb family protein [Catenulispora sp.]|nr:Dabb family protein [Catenulispora sp.]
MILHLVLFALDKGLTAETAEVGSAVAATHRLRAEVPALRAWHFGQNFAVRRTAYDFAGIGLLDDEAALAAYLADPFHGSVSRMWDRVSRRVTADLHVPDGGRPDPDGLLYHLDLIKGD